MSNGNGQPPKKVASSYDDKFYDEVANSEAYKKWSSTKGKIQTATTNAFDQEVHRVEFDSHDQDEVQEGVNPFLDQFVDLNAEDPYAEHRAANQSGWEQAGLIVPRMANKAISEVLKMPGYLGGAVAAIGAEENEGWDTFVNNSWIKQVGQISDSINEDLLPVYVSKAVREGNLIDNLGSTAFWATEGADGAGFIASMLVPGAIFKSLGLGSKIMGASAKGLELASAEGKMAGAVRALGKMGIKSPEAFDVATTSLANTIVESAAEAGGAGANFDKYKPTFIKQQIAKGMTPEQAEESFKEQKALLERNTFVSNVPLLIVPNTIQSSMIWGKAGAKALETAVPSLGRKILNRAGDVVKASISEGVVEEAGQSTIETMFTEKAKKAELGTNYFKDFNMSELADNYLNTISSTDGQKAMFLGAFFGGGMSAYHGAKEDIQGRKESGSLLNLAQEGVAHYNSIVDRDIYKRDADGTIMYNHNNKPILDEAKVIQTARDLDHIDADSKEFEAAVRAGDDNKVKELKDKAVNNLIAPFISRGEVGLQALKQHLDKTSEATDLQESRDPSEIRAFTNDIMEKAKVLQGRYETYKGFSKTLINLENKDATKADKIDFYNQLADFYVIKEGEREDAKKQLDKLNEDKKKLLSYMEEGRNRVENKDFKEGVTEDIYRTKQEADPRMVSLQEQINAQERKLSRVDKAINFDLWNPKKVNKSFDKYVEIQNDVRKQAAEMQKIMAELETVNNAKSVKELDDIKTENEGIKNAILKKRALLKAEVEGKKAGAKKGSTNKQNKQSKESVEQFDFVNDIFETGDEVQLNADNKYLGLDKAKVEGKALTISEMNKEKGIITLTDGTSEYHVSFDTIAKEFGSNPESNFSSEGGYNASNVQTEEEVKSSKDIVHTSVDSKLVTIDPSTGKPYPWIEQAAIDYEQSPNNKTGNQVTFGLNLGNTNKAKERRDAEIAALPIIVGETASQASVRQSQIDAINAKYESQVKSTLSDDQQKAADMVAAKDFSNLDFLARHLPLDVIFSSGAKASVETYMESVKDKFERTSMPMRMAIVQELAKGTPIGSITTTIAGQNNGSIQIAPKVDNKVAENSLLGLYEVSNNIDRITVDNLYMVDDLGNLVNGKGKKWAASRRLAKGELYLQINTANGTPFPLKLNVTKINESQANALYELYKYRFEDIKERGKNTLVTNLPQDAQEAIKANLSQELALFEANGQKYDSLTVKDLIDFLIWDGSKNPKSQVRFYDSNLLVGKETYSQVDFDTEGVKKQFVAQLTSEDARVAKRHHVRFKDKKGGIKSLTIDNPNRLYLNYVINNGIVNTNAVVNEPTFQGNTSIYLTPDNVKVNGKESEFNPKVVRDKHKDTIGKLDVLYKKLPGLKKLGLYLSGQTYKDKWSNLYSRVSDLKGETVKSNPALRAAAKRGDAIDLAFRDFFMSTDNHNLESFIKTFDGFVKKVNGTSKEKISFGPETLTKLFNTFNSYAELFKEKDWLVYASGFTVGGKYGETIGENGGRIAGTTDFLVEDRKSGQRYIVDIKTSSVSRPDLEGYGGTETDEYDMAEKDKIQLNVYADLFKKMDPNSNIVGLYILPITIKADEGSYGREYTAADNLSDYNEANALLEVDIEDLHELLNVKPEDLIPKRGKAGAKQGFNVKGVAKQPKDKKFTGKGVTEGVGAEGTDQFDLNDLANLLARNGITVNGTLVQNGKVVPAKKPAPKAPAKKAPIVRPTSTNSKGEPVFHMGTSVTDSGGDVTAVTYTDEDKVTIDGQDYFMNVGGKAANRGIIAVLNKNNNFTTDFEISEATFNKIKAARAKQSMVGESAASTMLDNVWKTREKTLYLQQSAKEAPVIRPAATTIPTDTVAENKAAVNESMTNTVADNVDYNTMTTAKAEETVKALIKANLTNPNVKTKMFEYAKQVRDGGDVKAILKDAIAYIEQNDKSRDNVDDKTKCD